MASSPVRATCQPIPHQISRTTALERTERVPLAALLPLDALEEALDREPRLDLLCELLHLFESLALAADKDNARVGGEVADVRVQEALVVESREADWDPAFSFGRLKCR